MKRFKKSPWAFVLLLDIVGLFADITYEWTRAIPGHIWPY